MDQFLLTAFLLPPPPPPFTPSVISSIFLGSKIMSILFSVGAVCFSRKMRKEINVQLVRICTAATPLSRYWDFVHLLVQDWHINGVSQPDIDKIPMCIRFSGYPTMMNLLLMLVMPLHLFFGNSEVGT